MKRKVLCMLLATAMAFGVAACGSSKAADTSTKSASTDSAADIAAESASGESAESISTESDSAEADASQAAGITFPLAETLHFTGSAVTDNGYKLSESKGWQLSLDRANIEVELIEFDKSELEEKTNLLLAGGDYPDFFFKNTAGAEDSLGVEDGILIPLEDLIREYAPNMTALLDELDGWKYITASDGHIYSLPCIQERANHYPINAPMWINKRWLDNLGLAEPANMEELDTVLRAFKEQDANGNGDPDDEVPFTFAVNQFPPYLFLQYMEDGLHMSKFYLAVIDDELVYYPLTDGFKDNYLSVLTSWYQDGIIDQNAFTQKYEEMTVNGKAADIHGMFFRSTPSGQVGTERQGDYTMVAITSEYGMPTTSKILTKAMSITDKCKNPEVLIAWADWFYTEEGRMVAEFGIEGESYELYEDGTYSLLTPEGANEYEFITGYHIYGNANTPMYRPCLSINPEVDPILYKFDQMKTRFYSEGTTVPYLLYTEEESKRMADLQTQIHDYITVYTASVVTGKEDLESTYADFQATLREMGAEELFGIYKAAYERGGN